MSPVESKMTDNKDKKVELHTFTEVCEHLAKGGAAYRFGLSYPLYIGKPHGGYTCHTQVWGGSSGACIVEGCDFSLIEQASTNWVLIEVEDICPGAPRGYSLSERSR